MRGSERKGDAPFASLPARPPAPAGLHAISFGSSRQAPWPDPGSRSLRSLRPAPVWPLLASLALLDGASLRGRNGPRSQSSGPADCDQSNPDDEPTNNGDHHEGNR